MFSWLRPRKRRCENCRYYRVSPLTGKGWCQHPDLEVDDGGLRLYLVSARRLGCAHRPRVRWEPIDAQEDAGADEVQGGSGSP